MCIEQDKLAFADPLSCIIVIKSQPSTGIIIIIFIPPPPSRPTRYLHRNTINTLGPSPRSPRINNSWHGYNRDIMRRILCQLQQLLIVMHRLWSTPWLIAIAVVEKRRTRRYLHCNSKIFLHSFVFDNAPNRGRDWHTETRGTAQVNFGFR